MEEQAEVREGRKRSTSAAARKWTLGACRRAQHKLARVTGNHPNRQLQAEPPVAFRMGVMNCSQTRLGARGDINEI